MANAEHLKILKQGGEIWNMWRLENLEDVIDLSGADLSGVKLSRAHINRVTLKKANLSGADLTEAYLLMVNLKDADLRGTDFRGANLKAISSQGANFANALFLTTAIGLTDLSKSIGLDAVNHQGPSTLGIDTIQMSKGKIPIEFLRGCGLNDLEIEYAKLYNPELNNDEFNKILYKIYDLRAQQPLQISPLFISYSHADSPFVDKMEEHLNAKSIRFWRDMHHATAGRLETQIDRAIRYNPTVLLVLSENSVKSDWVQHEVRTARELEKETGRDVLCPVALDDSWKESPWPKRIMEQVMEYNILDFSKWEDDIEFGKLFKKLIDELELFYR